MRSRQSLEQELHQLRRARGDYLRWYGLDRDYFDRIGARLLEVRRQLAEHDLPPREGTERSGASS